MNKQLCVALLAAASLGAAAPATADEGGKRAGWLLNLDLDFGGDDLVTVNFEDGDSQSIKAGQGVNFAVGGWFRPIEDSPFEVQGLLGYKYTTTAASNADIKLTRTTLALNGIYRFKNDWFAGFGLAHHMGPKLDGDGFFEDIDFDDATGFDLQFGWKWIGLHYTTLDYPSEFYEDADAGHFGIRFSWRPGT